MKITKELKEFIRAELRKKDDASYNKKNKEFAKSSDHKALVKAKAQYDKAFDAVEKKYSSRVTCQVDKTFKFIRGYSIYGSSPDLNEICVRLQYEAKNIKDVKNILKEYD